MVRLKLPRTRTLAICIASPALITASVFFVFGDGWAMGIALAIEGALMGGVLGLILAFIAIVITQFVSGKSS